MKTISRLCEFILLEKNLNDRPTLLSAVNNLKLRGQFESFGSIFQANKQGIENEGSFKDSIFPKSEKVDRNSSPIKLKLKKK